MNTDQGLGVGTRVNTLANTSEKFKLPNTVQGGAQGVVSTHGTEDVPFYNVYGQRFHPYGNPNDYQYQNNIYAAVRSNEGAKGNQYQP